MSRKEGIELILVAGCDGLQELYEQLRRLHEEHGCRDGHDVGAGTVAEVELDGEPRALSCALFGALGLPERVRARLSRSGPPSTAWARPPTE